MKKIISTLAVVAICCVAVKAYASGAAGEGKLIAGTKHDFVTNGYNGGVVNPDGTPGKNVSAHGKCGACHGSHKVKKNHPLWKRDNPTDTGWVMWNGGNGQPLDGTQDSSYLTAAELVATGTGMCMSCHDGVTAIGSGVYMNPEYRGNWGRNLADIHPVGKIVPFGEHGWQPDLATGNGVAASNVVLEDKGSVGCLSCHSMHSSANSSKILRGGDRCYACHNR